MGSWRDQILQDFTPDVAKLTLVADPDGLLLEEGVLAGIRDRGFELIPFEDHIAFRYAYESKFRSNWDKGVQTDLVVVLRAELNDLSRLPYDLLQAGRQLSFNLGNIFPTLSYPVVASLDRGDLDALYEAQKRHAPDVLGDNATKEFVLQHVFEIVPSLIKQSAGLLRVLLCRHYRGKRIPAILDDRFVQILRQQGDFDDWPLEVIIPDREAFFAFLQERWSVFIDRWKKEHEDGIGETQSMINVEIPGPLDLPFEHDDIRVYIDNLFVEGFLDAVPARLPETLLTAWPAIGVSSDENKESLRRIDGLFQTLETNFPKNNSRYEEWLHFAKTWAELIALRLELENILSESMEQKIDTLQVQIDAAFVNWLEKRYAGLINLPPAPPVMLHHIPRFLSRVINDDQNHKLALVLVDGLSLDQWVAMRKALAIKRLPFRFREKAVFAWIPTITSVSRQAVFSGKPPIYYPNSINATDKEPILWTQFWTDEGLTQQEIAYVKGLGDGTLVNVEEIVTRPKTRAVGLVIDKVDKIMHGMQLGAVGMHNQIRQWAGQRFMEQLFNLLLRNGFHIYLTSDHGNIETVGCGRPGEGAAAHSRGERARIYSDSSLRAKVKERFPEAIEWPPIGLPDNYLPLLAPARSAFVNETKHLVSHGGAAIEEVIVPFVQIERKNI